MINHILINLLGLTYLKFYFFLILGINNFVAWALNSTKLTCFISPNLCIMVVRTELRIIGRQFGKIHKLICIIYKGVVNLL